MTSPKAELERKDRPAGDAIIGRANKIEDFGTSESPYQITTRADGVLVLSSVDPGTNTASEKFLYFDEKKNTYEVVTEDGIFDKYLQKYKGDLEKLRKDLYLARKISRNAYTTKNDSALIRGIVSTAREYTIDQVASVRYANTPESIRDFQPFQDYINDIKEPETDVNVDINLSSREQATSNFNQFMMEYFGRPASPGEAKAYYEKLNAAERKAVRTTRTTDEGSVSVGGALDEADRLQIMAETVKPILKGTTAEELATKGGKLAQDIAELKEFAADYGIRLSGGDALKRLTSGIGKRGILGDTEAEKQRLKEESKAYYSNLADKIDAGVSVGSIAKQFAYIKGQLLETPDNAIDVFDQDVQAALRNDGKQGLMSFTDFRRAIKQNPLWSKTQNAREEAATYADTILRSFGLI